MDETRFILFILVFARVARADDDRADLRHQRRSAARARFAGGRARHAHRPLAMARGDRLSGQYRALSGAAGQRSA